VSCDSGSGSGDYRDITWGRLDEADGDCHEGGKYVSYITADADDSTHDYDEVPAGGRNRWNHQLYFEEKPTIDADNCEPDDDYWWIEPNYARIDYDLEYEESGQNDFTTGQHNPDSNDSSFSYGISIGASFGPVSAGVSYSDDPGPISQGDTSYSSAYWEIETDSFPTCQEDNIGVYYDLIAQSNKGEYKFKSEDYFSYTIYHNDNVGPPEGAYTETPGLTRYPTFDIV